MFFAYNQTETELNVKKRSKTNKKIKKITRKRLLGDEME